MEFPEGWGGFKLKNRLWEGYGYFLEHHISQECIHSRQVNQANLNFMFVGFLYYGRRESWSSEC